jgi:uncharacterized protein (DUF58 family)
MPLRTFWRPFRCRVRPSRLPLWPAPRALAFGGATAFLLALSAGIPALLPIGIALGAMLCIATAVDACAGPRRHQLRIERRAPVHVALRVAARIEYVVENRSNRSLRVAIVEAPVRTLEFLQDEAIAAVAPRGASAIVRDCMPIARGTDAFGALYLWYESALGLVRRRAVEPAEQTFRVFPDLSAVERYGSLHVRNRLIEAGLRAMRLRGTGTEFESLREWTPGDAFRTIDWKASARRGKTMVAQHEVERSQNVMLVLDCGRLMTPRVGEARKFDYAITAALSLASVAGLSSDRVGVVAFAGTVLAAAAPRSTRSGMARLTDMLYDLEPRFEEANYSAALHYLRGHLHKRSLIVLLTDVVDPLGQAALLGELASLGRRHLLLCAFMNDAAVANALNVEPSDAASAYRAGVALELAAERHTAATVLTRSGAIVVDVPAEKLTTALIDRYLRVKQRGLL